MSVDYTKLLDGNSLKAIRTYITTYYQPINANLTSISGLATNVTGLIKMTNGVASLDGTSYAPLASPTFTGTVTLPTSVKIGTNTSTGLVKYTNGVLSIDTSSYKTDYRYRPISVEGTQKLANTSSTALNFLNPSGYNVVFEWDSTLNGLKAKVDLSGVQPLDADLTAIAALTETSGFLKKTAADTWSLGSLSASDIPNLDASKITSGTFADDRIASASTWNAKYTKPSGGIPASDLAESYILTSARGANNGVASLGADGKIPESQLPASVTSGMEYKGTFDATSGSTISGLEKGWFYICSTAGTKNPDGTTGPSDGYEIGDWAVYNGSSDGWAKIDNSDKVSSVNGQTGAITIPVASLTTTTGSEAVTVDSTSLQVVTRDTAQNITGTKRFVTIELGEAGTGGSISKSGSIGWASGQLKFIGSAGYNVKFYALSGTSQLTFSGSDGSAGKINVSWMALKDGSTHTFNSYLQWPGDKGTSSSPAILATLDDIGSAVTLTTTVGSEAITVGSDTLTLVTRDTTQQISGAKDFTNSTGIGIGPNAAPGAFRLKAIGTSYETLCWSGGSTPVNFQIGDENNVHSYFKILASGTIIVGRGVSTGSIDCYVNLPNKGTSSAPETLACLSDVTAAVGNVYTEQEALAILEGTAS